jgi:Glucosidase II beta subunit-like/Glucosidase II beta subunit-like protein
LHLGVDKKTIIYRSGASVRFFGKVSFDDVHLIVVFPLSKTYQCPQQKKLQIPYSRFRDGICDCCDGSDELPTVCNDVCDQVLAEERMLRQKMAKEFTIGYNLRQKEIAAFQQVLKEKQAEKVQVDEKLETVDEQLIEVETEMTKVKHEFMQARVNRLGEIAKRVANGPASNDSLTGLLEALTTDEITSLIVHSCQMAGEMERAADLDDSTCVPLRLAGLDAALMWEAEEDGKADFKRLHLNVREEGKVLADLLMQNAKASDHDKVFWESDSGGRKHRKKLNKRNRPGRRRLEELPDDDDYPEQHDDYAVPDDYIDSEDDNQGGEENAAESEDNGANSDNESVEQGIMDLLKETLFSLPRVAFLKRAKVIRDGIEAVLKESGAKNKGDEKQEEEEKKPLDKAAYETVKDTLTYREEAIQRGLDYAVSAKILLTGLAQSTQDPDQLRQDINGLAVGTLVYSKLSMAHVWQMLQVILSELSKKAVDPDNKDKTCSTSPWAASCPPRAVTRGSVTLPHPLVLKAAQSLCTTPTFTKEQAEACAADADNVLPLVMPDGYYGYEVVQQREENDPLEVLAAEWDPPLEESVQKALDHLDSMKTDLETQRRKMKDTLDKISDVVEGVKESRYGQDGELYALKDQCFSVKAGKYTYEACVFGSAAQKEGDDKSGTGLGRWSGAEYDNETGKRILKWTDGAKVNCREVIIGTSCMRCFAIHTKSDSRLFSASKVLEWTEAISHGLRNMRR